MDEVAKEKIYNMFLKWYAMPQDSRDPKTIPEFCEKCKIPQSLIAEFQHNPDYTDDLYREAMAWGKSKVPELLHHLYSKYLTTKNAADLRMYKDLLSLDKDSKKRSDEDSSQQGVLRELFNQSRK